MAFLTFMALKVKPKVSPKLLTLKTLLIMKGQKRNRGARKMNLFTTLVELSLYDSQNLFIKKDSFFEYLYDPP